jgi:hypothetical protein
MNKIPENSYDEPSPRTRTRFMEEHVEGWKEYRQMVRRDAARWRLTGRPPAVSKLLPEQPTEKDIDDTSLYLAEVQREVRLPLPLLLLRVAWLLLKGKWLIRINTILLLAVLLVLWLAKR